MRNTHRYGIATGEAGISVKQQTRILIADTARKEANLRAARPWTVWTLGAGFVALGVLNLWLAWDHVLHASAYRDLGVGYPPLLRGMFGAGWGVLWLGFGAGFVRRRCWAWRWILLLASNYGAFGVLWMVAFAASDFGRGRILFQAALTVVLLLALGLSLRWGRVRRRFCAGVPR